MNDLCQDDIAIKIPKHLNKRSKWHHKAHESDKKSDKIFVRLLQLNKLDWPLVLVGIVFSGLTGCLFPVMAIPFSEALRVSSPLLNHASMFEHILLIGADIEFN